MAKWTIDGIPAEMIWRDGKVNGSYTISFRKDDATLADIESINWENPTVERGPGNTEKFHVLPEGYGFKLDNVNYLGASKRWEAKVSTLKQYLGDVTGYQAQIDDLRAQLAKADEEAVELESDLEQAYELLYGGETEEADGGENE